jgi:hypothetical protein
MKLSDLIHRAPIATGVVLGLAVLLLALGVGALLGFAAPPADPESATTVGSAAAQANQINWNTIILAFFGLITSIATTLGGIYLVKLKSAGDVTGKVIRDTHTLVNSNMGIQLRLNSVALRRIASLTGLPDDAAAASLAESAYAEHLKKQALVDDAKNTS